MPSTKRPSPAYIDGGLAAFIAQAAIAGFLGALWVLKGYWYRIKAYFSGAERSAEAARPEGGDSDG